TDHHADAVRPQVEQVVEVPAHRLRLAAARRYVDARRDDEGRRQQLELQVAGQLQLPEHALLPKIAGDEPRVFDRRADLVGDRGHQFAVARGERVSPYPVGQVDHADGLAARPGLGGEHGADDLGQLLSHPRACARGHCLLRSPVRDLEPEPLGFGNRLEPGRALRRPGLPGPAQPQARPDEPLEHGEQPLDPAQPARSVRHTEFPFSLKATWSTRLRSTNRPRPSSRSRRSGSVGSGTPAGSNPLPSSVTCSRTASRATSTRTRTRRPGSRWLPYAIALARSYT